MTRLATTGVLFGLIASTTWAGPPTAEEIEKSALKARLDIRTITVRFEVDGWNARGPTKREWSSQRIFWKDGDRIRLDYTSNMGNFPGGSSAGTATRKGGGSMRSTRRT
jgi:FtsP/CotA-like multicopper oxidase with cupredoxin domain